MDTRKRLRPAERRGQIVRAAVMLAEEGDYSQVSARAIGDAIGIAASSVIHHFKTMAALRAAIMEEAVRRGNVRVIAQGLRDGLDCSRAPEQALTDARGVLHGHYSDYCN